MWEISVNNDWNTHIVQILREKRDGNFILKVNVLGRLPKAVELSHLWVKMNLKYQDPEFYTRLFDEPENGSFEVPPVRTKTNEKIST